MLLRKRHSIPNTGLFNGPIDDLGGFGCILALSGLTGSGDIQGVGIDRMPDDGFDGCGHVVPGSEFITQGPVPIGLPVDFNQTIDEHNGDSQITLGGIYLVRSFGVDTPPTLPLAAVGIALLGLLRRKGCSRR